MYLFCGLLILVIKIRPDICTAKGHKMPPCHIPSIQLHLTVLKRDEAVVHKVGRSEYENQTATAISDQEQQPSGRGYQGRTGKAINCQSLHRSTSQSPHYHPLISPPPPIHPSILAHRLHVYSSCTGQKHYLYMHLCGVMCSVAVDFLLQPSPFLSAHSSVWIVHFFVLLLCQGGTRHSSVGGHPRQN